jgi:lysophospholipase L1-like esterase
MRRISFFDRTLAVICAMSLIVPVSCLNISSTQAVFAEEDIVNAVENAVPARSNMPENIVGEMLFVDNITPQNAKVLIDNSGMSGIEAPNHMHASFDSNDGSSNSKIADNMFLSDRQDIILDLGSKQSLGEMYIWNYNDIRKLDCCVRHIKVDYSEDGDNYKNLGQYELEKSSLSDDNQYFGNVACKADGNKSIDFRGVAGRYIRLTPLDNYGGNQYGLSEVRIFRHKTVPCIKDSLTVDGFAPEQSENTSVYNLFNHSGMNIIDGNSSFSEYHSNEAEDMAVLNGNSKQSELVMNLDGNYKLDSIKIWNYNNPANLNIGVKEFDVYYTSDAPCRIVTHSYDEINAGQKDYIDFDGGSWNKLGTYTLAKGTGQSSMSASITLDMTGKRAQHIKIVPKNNYSNGTDIFGLSEIRVYVAKGLATEYSREWTGMLSSSGEFKYQGNSVADVKGNSLNDSNNGRGWIGGDGIHSTSLNDSQLSGSVDKNTKTIFTFQDSFEGNFGNYDGFGYKHGFATRDNCGFSIGMRNMAYLMLEGDEPDVRNVQYYMTLKNGLSDQNGYGGNIYPGRYWLGDSTVISNNLYTVANRFEGLSILDADFFENPLTDNGFPDMTVIPYKKKADITANTGAKYHETIYEEGDYIYLYGRSNSTDHLVVSRVKKTDFSELRNITYWNGSSWVSDYNAAADIGNFRPGNEFNVTKMTEGSLAGKYVLIHTPFSITGAVCYAVSDSITGPFVEPSDNEIYYSTEKYKLHTRYYPDDSVIYEQWNYNAKSQPSISRAGELLITYHFGLHDGRGVPEWGWFNAVGKEFEHPTFIKMFDVEKTRKEYSQNMTENVTEDNVTPLGRTFQRDGVLTFTYANAGVSMRFSGEKIEADFVLGQDDPQRIAVFLDDKIEPEDARIITLPENGRYTLWEDVPEGEHVITIRKMERWYYGFLAAKTIGISSVTVTGGHLLTKPEKKALSIEVFGDSITNGDALYKIDGSHQMAYSWQGYVGEVARHFDADIKSCGISGNGLLASVLVGEDGKHFNLFTPQNNWAKLDESACNLMYDHEANPADVVIINLGTNDNAAFTNNEFTAQDFENEYLRFINEIHSDCPNAVVVGTLGAMGANGLFAPIRSAVSKANTQAGEEFAYFVELQNCNTITDGKAYDNSHPSAKAHKIYGAAISEVIENALEVKAAKKAIDIEGFQINTNNMGFRTIATVEPYIGGKKVVEHGLIYGIVEDGFSFDNMVVGTNDSGVRSFASTANGISSYKYTDSPTAINYIMTMTGNGSSAAAFSQAYAVRAYAKLSDGSYTYSDTVTYSIFDTAKKLYNGKMMNSKAAHDVLYNSIIKIVDKDYKPVQYEWNGL